MEEKINPPIGITEEIKSEVNQIKEPFLRRLQSILSKPKKPTISRATS